MIDRPASGHGSGIAPNLAMSSNPVAEKPLVDASGQELPDTVQERADPPAPDARVRQMVASHFDFIWRSLRRLGLSGADAEDGAQEVFMIAARKLDQIAAGRERSYLFGTALRVASTQRRTAARRREQPDSELAERADPAPRADEALDRRRARALLDDVLAGMDLELRSVFVLFELEEMTAPAIGDLLGIPTGTVASRLRRAREQFRAAVRRLRAERGEP